MARDNGARTWEQIGGKIGVYSFGTADSYRETWRSVLDHARNVGVKDIEKLTNKEIHSYLQSRIHQGVAHATYQKEAAAVAKLEQALNRYSVEYSRGNIYSFKSAINESRTGSKELQRFDGSRAYDRPAQLVAAVANRDHQIAAAIQHEGGARVHEASLIRVDQLKGYRGDPAIGQQRGIIEIQGKGGKVGDKFVSPQTYQALERAIQGQGEFKVDKDAYRDSLKEAAAATDQQYDGRGSHGLRWNFAQERFNVLQERGSTYEQALAQVSNELGHERAEITLHYLR